MKRKISTIILLLIAVNLSAQIKFSKDGFIYLPKEFSDYPKETFMVKVYRGEVDFSALDYSTQKSWIVYSDRVNNQTYDRASSNGLKKTILRFMEPLRVKEIEGNWFHVFSDLKDGDRFLTNQDRGWINVSNLVVCRYALKNEQSGIKKVMSLISLDEQLDEASINKEIAKSYPIYMDPNQQEIGSNAKKFQIKFVFKTGQRTVLIAKSDKLSFNGDLAESQVEGWMSKLHLTFWDHRVCLEPSSRQTALEKYGKIKIPVFPTKEYLKQMDNYNINLLKNAVRTFELTNNMLPANIMRMPILTPVEALDDDNNMKKVATIGTIATSNKNSRGEIDEAVLKDELTKLLDKQRNVNIVFAIDATKSMERYYKAISVSINEIIKQKSLMGLDKDISGIELRFGVIIYRDYDDKENAVEILPLTTNISRVENWLDNIQCYSNDNDIPEALYNGLITGLPKVGYVQNQSNILVLVGDAGNHYPDPKGNSIKTVNTMIEKYELSLIGFQVINGQANAYGDFNGDIRNMLRNIARNSIGDKPNFTGDLIKSNIPNTFKLEYKYGSKDVATLNRFGRFTYAQIENPMPTEILRTSIIDAMRSYMEVVNKRVIDINSLLEDGIQSTANNPEIQAYNDAMVSYVCELLERNQGMEPHETREWLKNLGEFSFTGYTNMSFIDDVPAYQAVVFLSKTEFDDVINTLAQFNISTNSSDTQLKLQRALIEQAKKMLGDLQSEDYLLEMTLNEIWKILLQVPFDPENKYGSIANLKLKEFTQKRHAKELNLFITSFRQKIHGFTPDAYRNRSFVLSGQRFYWIPLDEFPGS